MCFRWVGFLCEGLNDNNSKTLVGDRNPKIVGWCQKKENLGEDNRSKDDQNKDDQIEEERETTLFWFFWYWCNYLITLRGWVVLHMKDFFYYLKGVLFFGGSSIRGINIVYALPGITRLCFGIAQPNFVGFWHHCTESVNHSI